MNAEKRDMNGKNPRGIQTMSTRPLHYTKIGFGYIR